MKKIIALILTLTFLGIYTADIASAHPGRLDKRGGHTCWKNCSKWGLKYGQYHKHR